MNALHIFGIHLKNSNENKYNINGKNFMIENDTMQSCRVGNILLYVLL